LISLKILEIDMRAYFFRVLTLIRAVVTKHGAKKRRVFDNDEQWFVRHCRSYIAI
jgi:hypothetical protein